MFAKFSRGGGGGAGPFLARSLLNVISERISDDIPPQMKILNMVIPILMHFCSFVANRSVATMQAA